MDGSNWKRILLRWVNQTQFFERTFYNLEQSDIEEFFQKYREYITSYSIKQTDFLLFLKEQYPEFEPHLDDDNHLSSEDYMYVYSLLLHFSCVKCPDEYFHKICRSLQDSFQQAIAVFFKELLEKEPLTRANLRQAIADAAPKSVLQCAASDSPIRTPRNNKICPPTPKTNMLEEKTRELNLLKAQLDTERYEKGLLDVQLRQYEEKIEKLAQIQKKNTAEIHELKNELLAKSTENNSPSKNIMDEQIKKRLRKEIAEKEELILDLRENLELLKEEKILLAEKLSYSEKQVITCLEKIKEMDYSVNELKAEIEKKDLTIKVLTETKNELEHFIEETRSPGCRSDLNMSAECLDISLSRTTNSSGSISSPENLGCSVVDIQLKEKEMENANLREEIDKLKLDQSKLTKRLCDLIGCYADVFEICNENLIANEDGTLAESFMIFDNYVKNLVENYKISSNNVKQLSEEADALRIENKSFCKRLSEMEENLLIYDNQIKIMQKEKNCLEQGSKDLENKYESCIHDVENLRKDRESLLDTIETLKTKYEELKSGKELSEHNLSEKIKEISSDLLEKCNEIDKVEAKNKELSNKVSELLESISSLEENLSQMKVLYRDTESKNVTLENEGQSLKTEIMELRKVLKHREEEEHVLVTKNKNLAQAHDQLKLATDELKVCLAKVEDDCKFKSESIRALEIDVFALTAEKSELSNKVQDLIATNTSLEENYLKLQNTVSSLKGDILKRDDKIDSLTAEVEKLFSNNNTILLQYQEKESSQKLIIEKLRKDLEDCEHKFAKMSNDLKSSLSGALEENKTLLETLNYKESQLKELYTTIDTLKAEKCFLEKTFKEMKESLEERVRSLAESRDHSMSELSSLLKKLQENVCEKIKNEAVILFDDDFSDSTINELKNKLNIILNNSNEINRKNVELNSRAVKAECQVEDITNTKDKLIQKLNKSQNDVDQLQLEVKNLEASKCEYMNEVDKLKANLNNFEKERNSLSEVNLELRNVTNLLEQELQNVIQENMNLLCKFGDLESENGQFAQESKKLAEELDRAKAELNELRLSADSNARALKQEILILEASQKAAEEDIMSLRKKCEENTTLINSLESEKSENLHQIQSQIDTLRVKEDYISSLESENVRLKLKLEEISEAFSELEISYKQNLRDTNEKNHALENELRNLEASKRNIEMGYKKSQDALELVRNELENFKRKVVDMSMTNEDLRKENESLLLKINVNKIELENVEMRYATVKANLQQLEQEKLKAEENLRQSQDEISTLKHKVLDIVDQVKLLNSEKDNLIEKNNSMNEELRICKEVSRNKQEEVIKLEASMKDLSEKLQVTRESLASAQNEVSHQHAICQNLEQELKNLSTENVKLKENQARLEEVSNSFNKRLEKVSIKLGDSQAKVLKLEKENDSIKKDLENSKVLIESLQRENCKHQNDNKSLVEKLCNLQKRNDDLSSEKRLLEKGNEKLEEQSKTLQDSEKNLKQDMEKLEQSKKELEIKVKRLSGTLSEMTGALECAKSENINLDKKNAMLIIEINELKKYFEDCKHKDQEEKSELQNKCKQISEDFVETQNENLNLRKANEQLQSEKIKVEQENCKLTNELGNLSSKLKVLEDEHERFRREIIDVNDLVQKLQLEKENLEKERNEYRLKFEDLCRVEDSSASKSDERIEKLEIILDEKLLQINKFVKQIEDLETKEIELTKDLADKSEQLSEIKNKLEETKELYQQEKTLNEALQKDISIFKAKLYKNRQITEEKEKMWLEEKNKLISEHKLADERIKENRLELEGKLEKMKTKMKSIYNEEVAKIRSKHEREIGELRKELQMLSVKNEKYEGHVQKLSRQIYQLNETILELQRENKFMETKLKDYESCPSAFRKHQPTSSQVLGTDLRMEDEEGEVFNNTYLTDLKTGRVSPFGRDSVSVQELQYRNSLAPPHLRSTYSAQYLDQHLREEDIKDGIPINLDDSLSSLLHTGQRKKLTGTTSYKRPGPPTPSKNAGRLSFGGCIDTHPREILKESNDSGYLPSKKATPNKLKTFFTSSRSRDEFSSPSSTASKCSIRRRKSISRPLSAQFTSTPRKSKVHFDQRRQLEMFLNSSHSDDTTDELMRRKGNACNKIPAEKEFERNTQLFTNWRQPNINYATESESNSSCADKNDVKMEIVLEKKIKPKERRVSFFYRGNVYSRTKIPSRTLKEQLKSRAKNERYANFNKFRRSLNEVPFRKSLLVNANSASGRNSSENICRDLAYSNLVFDTNNNDSQEFELLLREKQSQAPFEITEPNFLSSSGSHCTTATSKTLYAGSVIVNRRIPHVNTTMVQKTSFYVVGNKSGKNIVEIVNQKITLVDLCRMWGQMSVGTKLVLILSFCMFLSALMFIYKTRNF